MAATSNQALKDRENVTYWCLRKYEIWFSDLNRVIWVFPDDVTVRTNLSFEDHFPKLCHI